MSAIIDTIVDVFTTIVVLSLTTTLIGPTLSLVDDNFKDWYLDELGEVMSWFGIDDEDLVDTTVLDQRLMDDEQVKNLLTKVALDHQDTQKSIIELLSVYSSKTRGTVGSYFNYGKDNYVYGLPDCNIRAAVVPEAEVISVIKTEFSEPTVYLDTAVIRVPTKEEYVYYKLDKLYGYLPYTNALTYLGNEYQLKLIDYNFSTNNYDCTIYREATVQVNTITEVTITVTPYVEAYSVYVIGTGYTIDDHVMFDPGTGSVAYKCLIATPSITDTYSGTTQYFTGEYTLYDDGSGVKSYQAIQDTLGNLPTDTLYWVEVDFSPLNATYWVVVDYDNKNTHTVVTEETIHSIEGTSYSIISDTSVDELIPAGSESDSYSIDTVYGVIVPIEYDTAVISIVAFNPVIHIVVKWYITDNSEWRSWTYELGSGNTVLDNAQRYLADLDMLPIVELRNSKVNVTDDTGTDLYIQSKEILDIIGIDIHAMTDSINESPSISDIEDAYIYFGISLKDTSPTIAKMMYNSIEFFYYDQELQSNAGAYNIRITEGKYNLAILWRDQTRTVITGSIGSVGTHTMTTVNNTLVVRKQETETQYIEYKLIDMGANTFIKRGIYAGVTTKTLQNDDLVFPVSFFMMNQLTPLEQLEVFCKALRLQTYALTVTHLEWYETTAFLDLIQIIVTVIAVVLFILTAPAGGAGGEAWLTFAGQVLAMYAASVAFQKLLESTKSPWLKALLSVAYVIAAAYAANGMSLEGLQFVDAKSLTMTVTAFNMTMTSYTGMKMEELRQEITTFGKAFEEKAKELEEMQKLGMDYISTEYVASLATTEMPEAFIRGVDLRMYQARDIQYDWDLAKGRATYDSIFEYDKYFVLGIV